MQKNRKLYSLIFLLTLTACAGDSVGKLPLTTVAGANTSTSPSSDDLRGKGSAAVRFVNALPGASVVDLFSNTTKTFSGVAYKNVTPYQEISGGRTAFFLRPAGIETVQAMAEGSESLGKGDRYTVISVAGEGDPTLLVSDDRLKPPANGKALIRAIHTALLAGKVDVFVAGRNEPVAKALTFKTIGDYAEIEPTTGTLEVRPENDNSSLLKVPDVSLRANGIYTLILTGRAKGTQEVEAIVIEDRWQ